ncbi:MAG: Crp/Fnr family transcriptional regulator [Deltaproteobacteria bacterium]|nr:Crp/Fnr family transcriptional regulator [Deltaproteobacteria bacterium]
MNTKPQEFLRKVLLFQSLDPEDCTRLAASFRRRSLKKGEVLFRKGDEGSTLYIIQEGLVKIVLTSETGDEIAPAILTEGDVFGEMALLDGLPRSADAVALEQTELMALSRSDFLDFLKNNEQAIQAVFSSISMRLRRTDDLLEDASFLTISTRLARRLLELAENHGRTDETGNAVIIDLRLTQRDLASMVGATRESVNKELRILRERGAVEMEENLIKIVDMERLRRRARL